MTYHARQANRDDAQCVFAMAGKLATSFVVEQESFLITFSQIVAPSHHQLLIAESADAPGMPVGYLLGEIHLSFYANGSVGWVEELYVEYGYRSH